MIVFFSRLWLPCQIEYFYISKMRLGIKCVCRVFFFFFFLGGGGGGGVILAGMLLNVHKDLQLQLQLLYYYALFTSITTC